MMTALRAIVLGIVALFVDDGALALGLLGWTAVNGLAVRAWPGTSFVVLGGALFFGYVAILLGNVAYAADAAGGRRRGMGK